MNKICLSTRKDYPTTEEIARIRQTPQKPKGAANQCYVLENDQRKIGVLRYNLFWDNTPFCTLLFIHPEFQRIGYGKAMMAHWEKEMKANGYGMVMTSTQVDEMAQHFYRKLGYKDAGGIIFEIPGFEQPMEMIMIKGI